MFNAFRRRQDRYGDSAPVETPYHRAAQAWDDRLGSARVQARNWRVMAFACAGLAAIAIGGLIHVQQNTRIATYVVPVDRYGRPGRIEMADRAYVPAQAEKGYFVADFVQLVRSKSTDPVVLRQNWLKAYGFVSGDAQAMLSRHARDHDPFARLGQQAVTVEIVSVLPRGGDSYQVQWRETTFERGAAGPPVRWTGLFTTAVRQPRTEEQLRANPLGLLITSFQWSREL